MPFKIVFCGPMDLKGYNRSIPESQQPLTIPRPFIDAMVVRESVFVQEQGVPLMMEADQDDARCCHWIAYSTNNNTPSHTEAAEMSVPVGTIRLVPFPHDPHPLPGSSWDIPEDMKDEEEIIIPARPQFIIDRSTSIHDGKEAYVKFGRWAVVKAYRGQGIATALVKAALDWLRENPKALDQEVEDVPYEQTHWNGLVGVHAQEYVARGWQKLGFEIDQGMGKW